MWLLKRGGIKFPPPPPTSNYNIIDYVATFIPSQINPSPVNPVLQVHVTELLVSVHTALMLQGLDLHPEKIATS